MNTFNMKIANNAPKTKNGIYPFSEKSINNIPYLEIFVEPEINELITKACKDVLYRSMSSKNKYRYGEHGILLSTLNTDSKGNKIENIYKHFQGKYDRLVLCNEYNKIINERKNKAHDLIIVHNHPNNSTFSGSNLIRLYEDESLLSIIAVGNRHNIFIVIKTGNLSKMYKAINRYVLKDLKDTRDKDEIKILKDKAAILILNNHDKYNLEYFRIERRNK